MPIYKLMPKGRGFVTSSMLAGVGWAHEVPAEHFTALDGHDDAELVTDLLASAVENQSARTDEAMAIALHQAFRIDRRSASVAGIWHWLTLQHAESYVRARWGAGGEISRDRVLGSLKRNALSRLWWGAELTVSENGYGWTQKLFSSAGGQDLFEQILGRRFSGYPPAVYAFLDSTSHKPRRIVRPLAETFSQMLGTLVLESLSYVDILDILERTAERIADTYEHRGSEDVSLSA